MVTAVAVVAAVVLAAAVAKTYGHLDRLDRLDLPCTLQSPAKGPAGPQLGSAPRCRKTCERDPIKIVRVAESDNQEKVHMYAQNILDRIFMSDTSAEARDRRPAGDLARRIPP